MRAALKERFLGISKMPPFHRYNALCQATKIKNRGILLFWKGILIEEKTMSVDFMRDKGGLPLG
jgi:hypothetical protein